MSEPKLIVMLTHNDYTVKNALEIFEGCIDSPAQYWGAKEQGLPREELATLFTAIRRQGKTPVLEVVAYEEGECLAGAELAIACGCEMLIGSVFFDSVNALCRRHHLQYFPYVGQVSQRPSVLDGTAEEMGAQIEQYRQKGVSGINLLGYRYLGDGYALSRALVPCSSVPVCLAGGINSFPLLDEVKSIGPAYFTIGGAFFEDRFGSGMARQIETVCNYMKK